MPNYRALVLGGFYSSNPYDKSVPVSIRCNNPGAVNGASWETAMPGYVATVETTPGNKTTIFETPEQGVAVWYQLMLRYRAADAITLRQIITRYGGAGQDYSAYVVFVANLTGLAPDAVIDLNDFAKLLRFAKAMFRNEAGRDTPLSDAQILYGFALGHGSAPPQPVPPKSRSLLTTILDLLLSLFRKPTATSAPPWYTVALKEVGFHETGENQGIERYIAKANCGTLGDPWCAIFANFCLETSGVPGSRSAMARSFETNANFVKLSGPALGAIVTNWRGSPSAGTGHVFFYAGESDKGILALGGNQSNQVCKEFEPRERVVGYFWPSSVALPRIGTINVNATAPSGGSVT